VAYSEGEDERVLRAVQTVMDEGLARPVLIGRRVVIGAKVKAMGLRLDIGGAVEVLDPTTDHDVFGPLAQDYASIVERRGTLPASAERRVTSRPTVAAAMLLRQGKVDAALVGGTGDWWRHMTYVMPIIPRRADVKRIYALSALILQNGTLFICDTHVNVDPNAEQIAEMTLLAADAVREFGVVPKVALLSHSSFGASQSPPARKMREALALVRERAPGLEVDGEMHADAALSEAQRMVYVSSSPLKGSANLLVMPTLDAANISLTLLSAATDGLLVGPLLLGMSRPLHVLVPGVTARGIVNITALSVNAAADTSA
jgi:malate dehydrogenase (oxaloacetate-decarboxylating)(NADP+)